VSAFDDVCTGTILTYPYLFPEEADRGREDGFKLRPTVVAVRAPRDGGDILFLLALSTTPPRPDQAGFLLPPGDVGVGKKVWVRLDSVNVGVIGRSVALAPNAITGRLSAGTTRRLAEAFREHVAMMRRVRRDR
jgi:hypothetical protein